MKPLVAIVGRPNVGKSTLFNRLTGARRAIVEDEPGVTRDRIYADCRWRGRVFSVIDTGGLDFLAEDRLVQQVRGQVELAVAEAQVIIMVLDGKEGPCGLDAEIVRFLRQQNKPVVFAVNKIDRPGYKEYEAEFLRLGIPRLIPVSAEHSLGLDELLDEVLRLLPLAEEEKEAEEAALRLAIVGRPNVGKSTLANALLGEERYLVSSEPGTTRDAVDTTFEAGGKRYTLIDTAGIRRRSRIHQALERYCVFKALRGIDRCQVALLLLEPREGVTDQDAKIASYIQDAGKPCIVVVNKWDAVPKRPGLREEFVQYVREKLKFMDYAPVAFISARYKKGVEQLLPLAEKVWRASCYRVPTGELNRVVEAAVKAHQPPSYRGRQVKIYYAVQAEVQPPTFVFFVNYPEGMHFSYARYLKNRIRQACGLEYTPLRLIFRERRRKPRAKAANE